MVKVITFQPKPVKIGFGLNPWDRLTMLQNPTRNGGLDIFVINDKAHPDMVGYQEPLCYCHLYFRSGEMLKQLTSDLVYDYDAEVHDAHWGYSLEHVPWLSMKSYIANSDKREISGLSTPPLHEPHDTESIINFLEEKLQRKFELIGEPGVQDHDLKRYVT